MASVLVAVNSCDVLAYNKRLFGVTLVIRPPQVRISTILACRILLCTMIDDSRACEDQIIKVTPNNPLLYAKTWIMWSYFDDLTTASANIIDHRFSKNFKLTRSIPYRVQVLRWTYCSTDNWLSENKKLSIHKSICRMNEIYFMYFEIKYTFFQRSVKSNDDRKFISFSSNFLRTI